MLGIKTIVPGKGRALIASRDIKAGESTLEDFPCLTAVDFEAQHTTCAACLRFCGTFVSLVYANIGLIEEIRASLQVMLYMHVWHATVQPFAVQPASSALPHIHSYIRSRSAQLSKAYSIWLAGSLQSTTARYGCWSNATRPRPQCPSAQAHYHAAL